MRRSPGERAWFPFEIDDDKILAGVKHLSEVEFPVNPDALRGNAPVHQMVIDFKDFGFQTDKLFGVGADLSRWFLEIVLQEPQVLHGQIAHRLKEAALMHLLEELLKIPQRSVDWIDGVIICDVVSIVPQG